MSRLKPPPSNPSGLRMSYNTNNNVNNSNVRNNNNNNNQ